MKNNNIMELSLHEIAICDGGYECANVIPTAIQVVLGTSLWFVGIYTGAVIYSKGMKKLSQKNISILCATTSIAGAYFMGTGMYNVINLAIKKI